MAERSSKCCFAFDFVRPMPREVVIFARSHFRPAPENHVVDPNALAPWVRLFRCLLGPLSHTGCAIPNPAATDAGGTAGFVSGWTLGLRFEGSSSSDGTVYDVGTAVGRNFTRHFGIDFGVPFYFIGTPSSTKQSNPGAASGIGIGNAFSDLRLNYPDQFLNFASIVHLTAPTGDTAKGLSTGHATWNLANHVDHAFGDFSPFLDA